MPVCPTCGNEIDLVAKQKFKNAMSTYVNAANGKTAVFNDDAEKLVHPVKDSDEKITWIREDVAKKMQAEKAKQEAETAAKKAVEEAAKGKK